MTIRKLVLAASVALAAVSAHAGPVEVHDFDIYVDTPTAFVFIKLPQGWKFVGQVDAKALADLPASVHTSLLSSDADQPTAVAGRTAGPTE